MRTFPGKRLDDTRACNNARIIGPGTSPDERSTANDAPRRLDWSMSANSAIGKHEIGTGLCQVLPLQDVILIQIAPRRAADDLIPEQRAYAMRWTFAGYVALSNDMTDLERSVGDN